MRPAGKPAGRLGRRISVSRIRSRGGPAAARLHRPIDLPRT